MFHLNGGTNLTQKKKNTGHTSTGILNDAINTRNWPDLRI